MSRSAKSFKTISSTDFSADFPMTSKDTFNESHSLPLDVRVVTLFHFLQPEKFSNDSHSAESVGSFVIFLKLPLEMLVTRNIKYFMMCCSCKLSNFKSDPQNMTSFFFTMESHREESTGKVTVPLTSIDSTHP